MTATALVKSGFPPGPLAPAPIQTLRQLRDPYGFLLDCHRRYGDVFTIRMIPCGTMVYVADPDAVRTLFADPRLRGGSVNAYMTPLLGNGLLTLDGDAHTSHRKLLAPLLAAPRVRAHEAMIAGETAREVATWRGRLALRPRFDRLALRVMRRLLFGIQGAELEPLIATLKARSMIDAATAIVARRVGVRTKVARIVDDLDRLVRSAIATRRESNVGASDLRSSVANGNHAGHHDRPGASRSVAIADAHRVIGGDHRDDRRDTDVLGALLSTTLLDDAIRDELLTLLFAGHETVATTLAWVFERAVRHPTVLARLSNTPDDDYVDTVIKETMRQRSCLPDVGRVLSEPTVVGRWHLPAGTQVFPAIVPIHMRTDLYPRPDEFRPERFLERQPEPWAFLPFGGGARRCVGAALAMLEMRVIVQTVFAHLRVHAVSLAPERGTGNGMTIGPHDGALVRVEPRG